MGFSGHGITMSAGQEKDISDEQAFLDLQEAGFVEQLDRINQPEHLPQEEDQSKTSSTKKAATRTSSDFRRNK
jgi:hypothetical protein